MPKRLLPSLIALIAMGLPSICLAQGDGPPVPVTAQTATDASHDPATTADAPKKRGISEEGGMKASGPSQGKGGESR